MAKEEMLDHLSNYKVLVCCCTYNQSKFIADSLGGFVLQKTNFPFVCLVMDDCSTDGEQDVIKVWMETECEMTKAEYLPNGLSEIIIVPHKYNHNCTFAFYFLKQNLYGTNKKNDLIEPWRNKCMYEAPCEGDDYWITKDKLQRQVDFLDSHTEYTACWHNALVKWDNHSHNDYLLNNFKSGDFTVADVVRNWQIQFATIVIRTDVFKTDEYKRIESAFVGSYNYFLASAVLGNCYGFNETMSVYRKNDGGISASKYSGKRAIYNVFKADFAMVYATRNKEAISVQDQKGYRYLINGGIYNWIKRRDIDIETVKLINSYNNKLFFKALPLGIIYPFIEVYKRHHRLCQIFISLLFIVFLFFISCRINSKWPIIKTYWQDLFIDENIVDTKDIEPLLRRQTYKLISQEKWNIRKKYEKTFIEDIEDFKYSNSKANVSVYDYGEFGLLMYYSYLYANKRNDIELKSLIQEKFNKKFKDNSTIVRNDQITFGNLAILLYKDTKDVFYKAFADKLYHRLDSMDRSDGLILYHEGSREQHVDAIGLVAMFLNNYYLEFNKSNAKRLYEKLVNEYIKWGTDHITGIPVQTYNVDTHIKCNNANWGRGMSWYTIGIQQYKPTDYELAQRIQMLDSTLITNSNGYPQYYGQIGHDDLSVEIPLIYYLHIKGIKRVSLNEFKKILVKYMDGEGNLCWGSPSISYPNEGPDKNITNLFTHGLCLYMLSILE